VHDLGRSPVGQQIRWLHFDPACFGSSCVLPTTVKPLGQELVPQSVVMHDPPSENHMVRTHYPDRKMGTHCVSPPAADAMFGNLSRVGEMQCRSRNMHETYSESNSK
jgi:hypothetical protein